MTYTLRYTRTGDIHFNDPRLNTALTEALTSRTLTINGPHTDFTGRTVYGASLTAEDGDADLGVGRTPLRALRNALGWYFGSHDLAQFASDEGISFLADSAAETIEPPC